MACTIYLHIKIIRRDHTFIISLKYKGDGYIMKIKSTFPDMGYHVCPNNNKMHKQFIFIK